MLSLFGVATAWIWFYSIVAIECIVLLSLIENNRPGWSTVSLLTAFGLLKIFTGQSILSVIGEHPGVTILFALVYFVAGTAWAVTKWWLYVIDHRDKYNEAKLNFKPTRIEDIWENSFEYRHQFKSSGTLVPQVRNNKGRIMTWMCYWPWSMIWTVINDPIKKTFKMIYDRIQDTLQSISNNVFKDVK